MTRLFPSTALVALLLALSGCSTVRGTLDPITPRQATSPHTLEEFTYMSNRPDFEDTNLTFSMLEQAAHYYPYALMANNSYDRDIDNPKYIIPGWTQTRRLESDSGLAIDLWEGLGQEGEPLLVVVIEGTNNSPPDQKKLDWSNNFGRGEPAQYREAFDFVAALQKERTDVRRIRAVGHSLGGGIALNLSLRLAGVDAVVFNSSPRAFTRVREHRPGAERIHFTELGEGLSFISAPWLYFRFSVKGYAGREYTAYRNNFMDFRFFKGSAVKEHSMYRLSRALLLMAVSSGNENARVIFEQNIAPLSEKDSAALAKMRSEAVKR